MKKIAILACSNAGLDYLDAPKDIEILRSVVRFNDEEYEDYVGITTDTFYTRLKEDKNAFPKTAYVSVGKIIEIFEGLIEKGYEEAIVVTISSKLSGLDKAIYNTTKDMNIKVTMFDSKIVGYAQAYMVLKAHEMVEHGKSVDQIMPVLEQIRDNNKVYIAVETIDFLVKNGRLSKTAGFVANLAKIKPILTVDDGAVAPVGKVRTFRKALDEVINLLAESVKGIDFIPYILDANNPEYVEYVKSKLRELFPDKELIHCPLTPVVGAHVGPGGIGLGFIKI